MRSNYLFSASIDIRTFSAIVDRRPVYALLASVDGQVYFLTWDRCTHDDAFSQISLWAIETGTLFEVWRAYFHEAEGTTQEAAKVRSPR